MAVGGIRSGVEPGVLTVTVLRELFRNLQAFHAIYEAEGIDTLIGPDGSEWSLWDLDYLHQRIHAVLPPRQRQAIELCLVRNIREQDAAVMMGVSPTNPVSAYAASGLTKLIAMIEAGEFPRFRWDSPVDGEESVYAEVSQAFIQGEGTLD